MSRYRSQILRTESDSWLGSNALPSQNRLHDIVAFSDINVESHRTELLGEHEGSEIFGIRNTFSEVIQMDQEQC